MTTFAAEAMPLIRYRTGDIGRMVEAPCACGGRLPRLGRIDGRIGSGLVPAGGGGLSIHRLDEILFGVDTVRGFRASLDRAGGHATLVLTVDAAAPLDSGILAAVLDEGVGIEVRYAPVRPSSGTAKRRISLVERE